MTKSNSKYPPQRTCIACRLVKEKKALIRIVRTENGDAEIDALGKKSGRGAYLCSSKACWELALKKNRLEHALRTKLNECNRQTLVEYSHNLLEES
jgi:predicted RNA-binding protein YlxR (DUF448 family)